MHCHLQPLRTIHITFEGTPVHLYVFSGLELTRLTLWFGTARRALSTLDDCINPSVKPCDNVHICTESVRTSSVEIKQSVQTHDFSEMPMNGGGD